MLIIGCGSIGERHLRCFSKTGRADVTACDSNAALLATMAQKYGVQTTPNWEEALKSGRYSAAVICTPAPLHIPMALLALASDTHILIEKPLSHSLTDVDLLLETSRQHPRLQVAVAYVMHVFPFLIQARDFILSGAIGAIRQVTVNAGQPFHRHRPAYAQSYYRDRRSGGGAIQDALTHSANWMESVLGPTNSVMCDCAHQALADVDVEDTVHVSARNGATLVNYSLNQFQPPSENTTQLNSEHGSVRIEFHQQRWGVYRESDSAWNWHEARVADRDAHFTAQANAFLDQIEGHPPRLCSLEAAAQTLRFNLAALASAESGARVSCKDLQP